MNLQNEIYTLKSVCDNVATIDLLPDSVIFQAHFPGNPVTPGVCQVGIVQELAEVMCGCELTLREIKNIKFMEVLKPEFIGDVVVTFDKMEEDGNKLITRGVIASEGKPYTKFSLVFERV